MSRSGSINQAPNGTWSFRVDIAPHGAPRRVVHKRGFALRRDAQAALTKLLGTVQAGTFVVPDKLTVAEWADMWLENRAIEGLAQSSLHIYRQQLDLHILPVIGHGQLQKLSTADIDRLYAGLHNSGLKNGKEGGLSPRSIQLVHGCLGKMLRDAVKKGLLVRNPAEHSTRPSRLKHEPVVEKSSVWSRDELGTFLAFLRNRTMRSGGEVYSVALQDRLKLMRAEGMNLQQIVDVLNEEQIPTARGGRWARSIVRAVINRKEAPARKVDSLHALYRLVAMTGMRRGEVLGLRWDDIDLLGGKVDIRQQVVRVGNVTTISGDLKTRGSRRTVSIDHETVVALTEHRDAQRAHAAEFAGDYRGRSRDTEWANPAGLVFTNVHGGPMSPNTVTVTFKTLIEAAGVREIRFHDLRHTHASMLLAVGVNIKVIAERLGHTEPAMTLRVYSHLMPEDDQTAVVGMARYLHGMTDEGVEFARIAARAAEVPDLP